MDAATPADVRATLAALDSTQQKIVVGLLAAMIREPEQVREREWIAERLTEFALLAGGFGDEAENPLEGVEALQAYLRAHADTLLGGAYMLFQRVGLDLAERVEEGFTFEDAMQLGLGYLPADAEVGEFAEPTETLERNLGEQPLAQLMGERGLQPHDLVAASGEQLTHKMVTRAMKGRRLTPNAMGKVLRAWNQASGSQHSSAALFNYVP